MNISENKRKPFGSGKWKCKHYVTNMYAVRSTDSWRWQYMALQTSAMFLLD